MHVVMPAAGRATRLRPLTDRLPKCLLEIGKTTILARTIAMFADHGVRSFTIVDGFEGDRLRRHLTERFPAEWFTFARNTEFASTNNAYSLAMGRYACDQPMLLSDADLLFEEGVLGTLLASPHENRLALRSHGGIGEEEMKAAVDSAGRITNLSKELPVEQAAGESIGLEFFSPAFAKRLFDTLDRRMFQEKRVDEYYEASFVELIERGEIIHAVDIGEHRCMEIDTLEDLERARQVFG